MISKLTERRKKVTSTAFSEFVRNASAKEKRKFFDKVVRETITEQKEMIAKANQVEECTV